MRTTATVDETCARGGNPQDLKGYDLESLLYRSRVVMQQVLTLVSNERVPLSDAMRMVFEINSLKNATPATVSRAGILFINETGEGPVLVSFCLHVERNSVFPARYGLVTYLVVI